MHSDADADQAPAQGQSVEDKLADKLYGPAKDETPADASDEADEPAEQADDDQAGDDGDAQASAAPAVDEVEVEVDGWKGKIPAKLKAELDKGRDYTRKTQELAEHRRIVEAHERLRHEEAAFMQASQQEFEALRQIEAQLEQYRRIDISQVEGETLSRMSIAAANLREEREKLAQAIHAKRGQFRQQAIAYWDQMSQKAHDAITKSIPSWDQDVVKLGTWAVSEGFSPEFLTGYDRQTHERIGPGLVDPIMARMLHAAWKYHQLQAGKSAAQAKAAKAAPVLRPGAVDARNAKQIEHMNFRKAIKQAKSDGRKAELIGEQLARKFNF